MRELSAGVVNAGWEVLWCHDYHVVKLTKENFMSTKIQRNQAIMTTEKKIMWKLHMTGNLALEDNSAWHRLQFFLLFCNLNFLEREMERKCLNYDTLWVRMSRNGKCSHEKIDMVTWFLYNVSHSGWKIEKKSLSISSGFFFKFLIFFKCLIFLKF